MLPDFQRLTLSSSSSWKCNQPRSDLTPRVRKFTWQKMLNVRDLPLENNLVGQSLSWQITHLSNLWAKNPPLEQATWCSCRTTLNSTVCQKTCNILLGVGKKTTFHSLHWVKHSPLQRWMLNLVDFNAKLSRFLWIVGKSWTCCLMNWV